MCMDNKDCSIRKIDKYSVDYDLYRKMFRQLFDSKFNIVDYTKSPFFIKDNSYFFCEHENQVIGGANVLCVTETCFNRILSGELLDDMQLKQEDISYISKVKTNHLYIASIFIGVEHQKKMYGSQFLKLLIEHFLLINCNAKFASICINTESVKLHLKNRFSIQHTDTQSVTMVLNSPCKHT